MSSTASQPAAAAAAHPQHGSATSRFAPRITFLLLPILLILACSLSFVSGATSVPTVPTSVVCQSGPSVGGVVVSFLAPSSNGGYTILFYTTKYSTGSGTVTYNYSSTSPFILTGLTSGSTYSFQVAAVTVIGTGTYSTSVSCIAGDLPTAPYAISVAYDDSASVSTTTISYSPPTYFGGLSAVNYQINLYSGSTLYKSFTSFAVWSTTSSLPAGTYGLSVAAFTNIGSTSSANVTFTISSTETVPSAPRVTAWAPFATGVQVYFQPPIYDGGSVITSYTLLAGGSVAATGTSSPLTATGLSTTANTTLELYATNSIGDSDTVTTSTKPSGSTSPPAAPTNFTVTYSTDSSVNVNWNHADYGSSRVTAFIVYYGDRGSTGVAIGTRMLSTTSKPATITGLTCSETATFYVEAVGSSTDYGGLSSIASSTVAYTSTGELATVPQMVQGVPLSSGLVSIYFVPPASGSLVQSYLLYYVTNTPVYFSGTSPIVASDGLVVGVATTFSLWAITCSGNSPQATVTVTPSTATAVPAPTSITLLTATSTSTTVTLTYSLVSNATTNYVSLYLSDGTTFETYTTYNASVATHSLKVTGLTNGVTYTFLAIARSTGGPSPNSNTLSAMPYGSITAVQNLTCVSGPAVSAITCTWNPPADTGGLTVTEYDVVWTTSSTTSSGTQTPDSSGGTTTMSITGLTAGSTYTVSVVAVTAYTTSPNSTVSVIAGKEPSVPGITCTEGDATVGIDITAPSNFYGQYLKYYLLTDSVTGSTVNLSTSTTYTYTDLTNGVSHTFSVRAYDDAGGSQAATATCTPAAAPNCPTDLVVVSGPDTTGQVTANWSYVSDDGGSDVTSYLLTWSTIDGLGVVSEQLNGVDTLSYSPDSLVPNELYAFTVVATNAMGTTTANCSIVYAQAAGTPDPPDITAVTPADSALVITIQPNSSGNTGGVELTEYVCTLTPGSSTVTHTYDGTTTSFTASDLTNGETYSITCVVWNSVDAVSLASVAMTGTPSSTPGPVIDLVLTSGPLSGQILANWTAPVSNGGSALTAYRISWSGQNYPSRNGSVDVALTPLSYQLSGLVPNATYNVTVRGVNVVGAGAIGVTSSAWGLAASPPCPVTNLIAYPIDTQLSLTWSAPSCTGGLTVLAYYLTVTNNATGALVGRYSQLATLDTSRIVANLSNGLYYSISVTAANTAGNSTAVTVVAKPATTPDAPLLTGTVPSDGQLRLLLAASSVTGGLTITGFTCYYNVSTLSPTSSTLSPVAFTLAGPFTITGLTNGQNYSIVCTSSNADGASPLSAVVYGVPASVPDAPTALTLVSGPTLGAINASWTAPTWNGGLPVTGYNLSWAASSSGASGRGSVFLVASVVTYVLSGLTPNGTYFVAIQAVNVIGSSTIRTGTGYTDAGYGLAANVPCAPSQTTYTRASQAMTATWSAPLCDGGMTVQYYYLYLQVTQENGNSVSNGASWIYQVSVSSTFTLTVSNLTNGWVYSVQMSAANVLGNSSLTTLSSVAPATVASAPTSFSCVSGPSVAGSITSSWAQPSDLGGVLVVSSYALTFTRVDTGASTSQSCANVFTCTNLLLTARANYSVTVAAVTTAGTGTATAPQYCTAAAVPDAISSISCSGTDSTLTISFTAPWSNLALTKYVVNYTILGVTASKSYTSSATAVSLSLTGVSNENPYTVLVYACNAAGCGVASSSVSCAAGTAPSVPTSVVATPYNNEIVLTYGVPASGSAVVTYTAYLVQTGATTTVATGVLTMTFSSLTMDTSYTIRLWATNAFGSSSNVTVTTSTLRLLPPDNMVAFEPESEFTPTCLVWFTPSPQRAGSASVATSFIVSYRLYATSDAWQTVTATSAPVNVSGLETSSSYSMRVVALNSYATSDYSTTFICVTGQTNYLTQPGAPTVVAGPGMNQSVVAISAPSDLGGSSITSYKVYTSGKGGSSAIATAHFSIAAISDITFGNATDLLNGYTYYHYVIASNGNTQQTYVPLSEPSALVSTAPLATYTVPSAVSSSDLTMSAGDVSVTLSVLAAPTSSSPILGYLVQWPVITVGTPVASTGSKASNSSRTILATGNLINGVATRFEVQAVSGAGYSAALYTAAIRPGVLPGPPRNVVGSPRDTAADVYFDAPSDSGSNTVTAYYIYNLDGNSSAVAASGSSAPIAVANLTNYVANNLTICSVSSVSPTESPLWWADVASSSCTNFSVVAFPTQIPNLNGSLVFARAISALPTSGVRGLDNLCLAVMPHTHALVCDSVTSRTVLGSFWYQPDVTPVYAFNAFLFAGADYSIIANNADALVASGIQVGTGFASNFTAFFDETAPIGVTNLASLTSDLATAPAFTGCTSAGVADSTQQCTGWTLSTGSTDAVLTGNDYDLSSSADYLSGWLDDGVGGTCGDTDKYLYCVWFPSADDGIQNGDETGVDCGGTTLLYDGSSAYPCVVAPPNITCPAEVDISTSPLLATGILVLPNVTVVSTITYSVAYTYVSPTTGEASNGDLLEATRSPWTIQATVTDGKSQTASCTFPVYVLDHEAPTITCPNTVTADTDTGKAYATGVTWTTPTGGDIFDNVGVVSVYPVASTTTEWPVGTNTETLYAADAAGNVGNCSFLIVVSDIEPPTITYCPTAWNQSTDAGQRYATLAYPWPTATDNVGLASNGTLVQGSSRGSLVYVDTATGVASLSVRIRFSDAAGNTNDCAFTVTIRDEEPPTVTCPANIDTHTDAGASSKLLELTYGSVTDNVNLTETITAPQFAVGLSRVEILAFDEVGNSNSCVYIVNVTDAEAPVLTCPADVTVTLASGTLIGAVTWTLPTMTDNVGVTSYESNYDSGDMFAITTNTTVRYNASDAAGNVGYCSFALVVYGSVNTPQPASGLADPSIQCPSDVLMVAEYASTPASATVSWSAPTIVNSHYVASVSGSALTLNDTVFTVGTYTLTYAMTDTTNASVTTSCSFTVTVTQLTSVPEIASRAQISLTNITTNLLETQLALMTAIGDALGVDTDRISIVSLVAGYSSTDVVLEFTQSATQYASETTTTSRRRLLATTTSTTTTSEELLALFQAQLEDSDSTLLTSTVGAYIVADSYVNCSSDVTADGVTRALHCPGSSSSDSDPVYRRDWFIALMVCLGWLILLLLLWCCGFIVIGNGRRTVRKSVVQHSDVVTVPWPEVRHTDAVPTEERIEAIADMQKRYFNDTEDTDE